MPRVRIITPRQRVVLQCIARHPDYLMKQLAYELDCPVEAAESITQKLKLNGFVKRPNGFRRYTLTPAGVEALAA